MGDKLGKNPQLTRVLNGFGKAVLLCKKKEKVLKLRKF